MATDTGAKPVPAAAQVHAGSMSRVCNREGVVWAKVVGYRPWPARIIADAEYDAQPTLHKADKYRLQEDDTLVVFFGSKDISWLQHEKAITPWKAGLKRRYHTHPSKTKAFRRALREVCAYCSSKSGLKF